MQPKWVHVPYLRTIHMFVAKSLNQALNTLKPDLVVRRREACGSGGAWRGRGVMPPSEEGGAPSLSMTLLTLPDQVAREP